MSGTIVIITFIATFAALMTVGLGRLAIRLRFEEALRRRLGSSDRVVGDDLLRQDSAASASGFAQLVIDSGFGWTRAVFIGRMAGSGVLAACVGAMFLGALGALVFGGIGAAVLPWLARRARDARMAKCDSQMPQALEVMSLALRAGHPLSLALSIAAAEAPSPIAEELRRAMDEHELGRPLGDVLVAMGKRLRGSEVVHTFIVAVLVLQQTGGNLIAVIDRIVENARARAQYQARLRALTSEGRSSARMLAAVPGVFFIMGALVDPTYAKTFFADSAGKMLFGIILLLWFLGVMWTRRIVKAAG
ncbi:MAG: hypothetical protein EXR73_07535 [Myxococcales bacterium]|nr:hypothetical protein [Myxococcales bacterium]